MSVIKRIRELNGFSDYTGHYSDSKANDVKEEVEYLLYDAKAKEVDNSFAEGGRWSNYESTVYKIEENGETMYVQITEEVPATEQQEGGDFLYEIDEVVPKEVTVIQYVII